jgi:hypothetical protein
MGMTIYSDWKIKADAQKARRLVKNFHAIAGGLGQPSAGGAAPGGCH